MPERLVLSDYVKQEKKLDVGSDMIMIPELLLVCFVVPFCWDVNHKKKILLFLAMNSNYLLVTDHLA